MQELAYVDATFCPIEQAKVSVRDRGFLFADGVYEVIVTYGGRPFRLREHLERLRRSLAAIRIDLDLDGAGVEQVVRDGIRRTGLDQCMVYLQVTRGAAVRSHQFPSNVKPTFVATFRQSPEIPPEQREEGITLITTPDIRWAYCHIKSVALLPNVLAKQSALDAGAHDAVFVTPDGLVHEASAANVFMIKGGRLRTPSKDQRILHGITRQYVLECARRIGLPVEQTLVTVDELRTADEVFITSTTQEVLGAVQLDGKPIGNGKVSPLTRVLYEQFLRGVTEAG